MFRQVGRKFHWPITNTRRDNVGSICVASAHPSILWKFLSSGTTQTSPWTSQSMIAADGGPLTVSLFNITKDDDDDNDDNKHVVLCLPGALGTGPSDFEHLLSGGLGDRFGIVAVDPRGLISEGGATTTIKGEEAANFYIRDALDGAHVMATLGISSRYSVMGWSDGANAAIHLAAHPLTVKSVDRLVVWGGNSYVTQEDVAAWESLRDIENWSPRMREQKAKVHGGIDKLQALNNKATDAWIGLYTDPTTAGDVCLRALQQVTCPTLVVHGSKDAVCDVSHARYIAKQIATADLCLFPEGKHNLHQRYADAFHQVVHDFLLEDEKEEMEAAKNDQQSDLITSRRDQEEPAIDAIAYAFMGSKALSTALKAGVFDTIHDASSSDGDNNGATLGDIERESEIKGERLRTLLSACVALNLIRRTICRGADIFTLPQASTAQLVQSSKHYWGDYIANQVDAQFFSRMVNLDTIMRRGDTASDGYEAWFESDPEAAKKYTEAQHNGSLATAYALHRRFPELADRYPNMRMLDVGGGSGAFSIATARKLPDAECVVLDLDSVTKVADNIIGNEEESVSKRVITVALSANDPGSWHGVVQEESFDVVLMSYISGSIPHETLPGLYKNAYRALKPGGIVILHDFFVDNDGSGPTNAALWALAHCTVNPEGMGLRPNRVVQMLTEEGFVAPKVETLIPKTTQTIVAMKPGQQE